MNLVAEAGLAGSDFEPFDPRERAKLGGYSKIGEKVLFLLEPERFPSLLRTGKTEVFLASEWNDWEKARDEEKKKAAGQFAVLRTLRAQRAI